MNATYIYEEHVSITLVKEIWNQILDPAGLDITIEKLNVISTDLKNIQYIQFANLKERKVKQVKEDNFCPNRK